MILHIYRIGSTFLDPGFAGIPNQLFINDRRLPTEFSLGTYDYYVAPLDASEIEVGKSKTTSTTYLDGLNFTSLTEGDVVDTNFTFEWTNLNEGYTDVGSTHLYLWDETTGLEYWCWLGRMTLAISPVLSLTRLPTGKSEVYSI